MTVPSASAGTASAQERVLSLSSGQQGYSLGPYLNVMEDPSRKLTVEEAASPQMASRFKAVEGHTLNLGITASVYWFRFTVVDRGPPTPHTSRNAQYVTRWYLDSGTPLPPRVEWTLYCLGPDALNLIPPQPDALPRFVLLADLSKPRTFFLRAESVTGLFLAPSITTSEGLLASSRARNTYLGIFFGIILGAAFYHLLLFFNLGDKNYLWYVLFIVAIGSHFFSQNGLIDELIISQKPILVAAFSRGVLGAAMIFGAQQARTFLSTPTNHPRLDKAFLVFMASSAGVLALVAVLPARAINNIWSVLGVLGTILAISTALISIRRGYRPARFFIMAWSLLLCGAIIFALTFRGVISYTPWAFFSFQIGAACQAVLLSVALGARIREMRHAVVVAEADDRTKAEIIEHLPDPTFVVDKKGRVVAWNGAIEELSGVPAAEVLGKGRRHYSLALIGKRRPMLVDMLLDPALDIRSRYIYLSKEGDRLVSESHHPELKPEGAYLWHVARPLTDGKGRLTGAIETLRDVTDRRVTEESLRRAMEATEKANENLEKAVARANEMALAAETASRAKGEFLANMSHEIRTPMNGVVGMAQALLETRLTPEQNDFAKMILDSANALLTVINDILDLSKVEAGKLVLESRPFNLREAVDEVGRLIDMHAQGQGIVFTVDYPPEDPEWFLGDAARIRQVLMNLAGNAIKFTQEGEAKVQVECISRQARTANMKISVIDSGIGVDEASAAHIFDKFSQADPSITRKYGGTGLGLAISQELVRAMGSEIGVHSRLGSGSKFFFTLELPFAPQPPESLPSFPWSTRREEMSFEGRILVVEDNPTNRQVALAMLNGLGCEVTLAENGRQALEIMESQEFDLVFMDEQMPVLNGTATIKMLRHREKGGCRTPVVALSASILAGDRQRYLEAGMDDHLCKPVTKEALISVLKRFLGPDGSETAVLERDGMDPDIEDGNGDRIWNPIAMQSLFGDDLAAVRKMVDIFLADTQKEIELLGGAVEERKLEDAARHAHHIKGSAGDVGGARLRQAAIVMEEAAKQGRNDKVQKGLANVRAEYALLHDALQKGFPQP